MSDPVESLRRTLIPTGPAITTNAVREIEAILGVSLPEVLTRVWRTVGAGHLIGYPGVLLSPSETARRYQHHRDKAYGWTWPAKLVPFADLGCGIVACVDTTANTSVWWFDPNLNGPDAGGYAPPWRSQTRLVEWLIEFANGSTFEDDWMQRS